VGAHEDAIRLDIRSGNVTHQRELGGCALAVFATDCRSVYRSHPIRWGGYDNWIHRSELTTDGDERLYKANGYFPLALAVTPNGHIHAIINITPGGGAGYHVYRMDAWHKTELEPIRTGADCLSYSRGDAGLLATGDKRNGVAVWQGKRLAEEWPEPAIALAWSPDGLLTWGHQDRLVVARPGSGEPVRAMAGIGGELSALEFSPDGKLLLAGTQQGTCSFTETATGRLLATFDWGIGPIHSVAFSPDGLTCAAGGENGQVVVWDLDA
jgi:WD40 repeat protein